MTRGGRNVLNMFIWVVGFVVLLILAGKIPARLVEWRIIELGAMVFWLFAGLILFIRFVWTFRRG